MFLRIFPRYLDLPSPSFASPARHEGSPCLVIKKILHLTPKSAHCANTIDLIQSLWPQSQELHQYQPRAAGTSGGQDFSAWVSADPD